MSGTSNAAVRGRQNKAAGALFEQMIEAACREYRQAGIAEIEKTPEAMKPLGHQNGRGQFMACYVKKPSLILKGHCEAAAQSCLRRNLHPQGKYSSRYYWNSKRRRWSDTEYWGHNALFSFRSIFRAFSKSRGKYGEI